MMKWIVGGFLAVAVAMAWFSFFSGGRNARSKALNCVGSTSIQPLAELLAEEYARHHPQTVIDVQGGGSTVGLQAIKEKIADIGMCSRSLKAEEAATCRGIPIAIDGLAIVVHPSNSVSNLERHQIRDIFAGHITGWKQVGGPDRPIDLITREEGSGTREAFVKMVMETGHENSVRISRKAMTQESNGAVKELVKHNPAAIGYMSLGLVHDELKILSVDGIHPTLQTVRDKRYSLVRPFLFVVRGSPSPVAQAFIDYVLSAEGQRILEKEGYVSAQ
jgi:phosphate transport system substrate-binding protein